MSFGGRAVRKRDPPLKEWYAGAKYESLREGTSMKKGARAREG